MKKPRGLCERKGCSSITITHKVITNCRSVRSWCNGVVGSILHKVDPLNNFSFQPVLHDWRNKCCGMCYPVYGIVHIKEPWLLLGKSSPCGDSGFPLSLSEWSSTICPTPNVLSASLNKTFPSFHYQLCNSVTCHGFLSPGKWENITHLTRGPLTHFTLVNI